MVEAWRLLLTGANDAFTNMAMDEAVLRNMDESRSTIRFYRWRPSAVSIGYFQGMHEEVDVAACRSRGIDVIRRITGGGAVYHDYEGEITYSIVAKEAHPKIPKGIPESYGVLCAGLVEGLRAVGLDARFNPINDIIVDGKKISGNAHTRRFNCILQHGTILCDVNPRLMFSLLKVPDEKIKDKLIKHVEERVTSIKKELGVVERDKVVNALHKGFEDTLDIELVKGELIAQELQTMNELREGKYATEDWNFKR